MLTPEDDLQLLNNEEQAADESKFAVFFLGPTYRIVKDIVWATGTVIVCLSIAALIFTYTERRYEVLNIDIGEEESDHIYINAGKYKMLKRVHSSIEDTLNGNQADIDRFEDVAKMMCTMKRDAHDFVWHYGGAIDYVIAVLTTTGWGVVLPVTAAGKFLTMVYFLLGVPIMLMFLYSLVDIIDSIFAKLRQTLANRIREYEANPDGWALYSVSSILFALLVLVVLLSAGISAKREHSWDVSGADYVPGWADDGRQNWVFWDAFYFQIVSMLTVGFGDFHHKAYDNSFGACQFFFVFIPTCLFLALSKTIFNQFREKRVQPVNVAAHD